MLLGLGLALATLIILHKMIGIRKIVGYQAMADISASCLFFVVCGTTANALTAAVWGGLFFSFILWCLSKLKRYDGERIARIHVAENGKRRSKFINVRI